MDTCNRGKLWDGGSIFGYTIGLDWITNVFFVEPRYAGLKVLGLDIEPNNQ